MEDVFGSILQCPPFPQIVILDSCTSYCVGRIPQSVQRLAMGRTVQGSNPGGGREFPHQSRPALSPTQPLVQCVPGLFQGKERPGRDADLSPPSSAAVKKGQSYTSTLPMGRTACTEPQCLYKSALYLLLLFAYYCSFKFCISWTQSFQNFLSW